MRKGKSVVGNPILSLDDGRRLDAVKDVLLANENDRIAGLLVDEGGLFSSSMIVPREEIVSFGRDAVVVRTAESRCGDQRVGREALVRSRPARSRRRNECARYP